MSRSSYGNATSLLAELLDDYDIRLRPQFGGVFASLAPSLHLSLQHNDDVCSGNAMILSMDVVIASFDSMSEVDMVCQRADPRRWLDCLCHDTTSFRTTR